MERFYVTAEVCVESLVDARAAVAGGADRLELCTALEQGGLTPSVDLLRAVRAAVDLPVMVMLRLRAGGFVLDSEEIEEMAAQARTLKAAGADGVVCGALLDDGTVNCAAVQRLVDVVAPLPLIFHRAFDSVTDQATALEQLITCGCARLLTSGDPRGVDQGRTRLADLLRQAGERMELMPGGGVRAHNVAELVRVTGARAVHFSAKPRYGLPTQADDVRAMVSALRGG